MAITTSSTTVQTFGIEFHNHSTHPRETSPSLWELIDVAGEGIPDSECAFVALAVNENCDKTAVIGVFSARNSAEVNWAGSGWPQRGYALEVTRIPFGTTRKHNQGH